MQHQEKLHKESKIMDLNCVQIIIIQKCLVMDIILQGNLFILCDCCAESNCNKRIKSR